MCSKRALTAVNDISLVYRLMYHLCLRSQNSTWSLACVFWRSLQVIHCLVDRFGENQCFVVDPSLSPSYTVMHRLPESCTTHHLSTCLYIAVLHVMPKNAFLYIMRSPPTLTLRRRHDLELSSSLVVLTHVVHVCMQWVL
jgi:hypothetical protein